MPHSQPPVYHYPLGSEEDTYEPHYGVKEARDVLNPPYPSPANYKKPFIFQQSFLGASITDFSLNLGYNGNASTLSVNLVQDERNYESKTNSTALRDGVSEGYHPWDRSAYPIGLLLGNGRQNLNSTQIESAASRSSMSRYVYRRNDNINLPAGDIFWAPNPGEPAYFKYYDGQLLTKECIINEQPDGGNTCSIDGPLGVQTPGAAVFEFNGIIKEYKRDWGGNGETYSVSIEDPRSILENTTVILDNFQGKTAGADAHVVTTHHLLNAGNASGNYKRRYDEGYSGFYNVLNVFGYYEKAIGFGQAQKTDRGLPWFDPRQAGFNAWGAKHQVGILPALQFMLGTFEDPDQTYTTHDRYLVDKEPYGSPLYYGYSSVMMSGIDTHGPSPLPLGGTTKPVGWSYSEPKYAGVRRYAVDLSRLYNLNATFNPPQIPVNPLKAHGIMPDDFRIGGGSMSLLQIITTICNAAGCDFFVELHVPKSGTGMLHLQREYNRHKHKAGIIRIIPIPKNSKVEPGIIKYLLDRTLYWKDWNLSDGGPWEDKVVSANVGYSHNDPTIGMFTVGAPLTRIVGVTHLGGEIIQEGEYQKVHGSKRRFDFFRNGLTGNYFDPAGAAPQAYDDNPDRDDLLRDADSFLELDGVALQSYKQPYFGQAEVRWPFSSTNVASSRSLWDNENHFKDYNADWGGSTSTTWPYKGQSTKDGDPDFVDNDKHYAQPIPVGTVAGTPTKPVADPYWFNVPWSKNVERVLDTDFDGRGASDPKGDYPMDGYIDLFPCWGFQTRAKQQQGSFDQVIESSAQGEPIKGMFIDDDPYRDFHPIDGLFGNAVFWNPSIGVCKTKPQCTETNGTITRIASTTGGGDGGPRCFNAGDCGRRNDATRATCRNVNGVLKGADANGEFAGSLADCKGDPNDATSNGLVGSTGEYNAAEPWAGCLSLFGPSTWTAGWAAATQCDNMPEICHCDPVEIERQDPGAINDCTVARSGHPRGCTGVFLPDCINWGVCRNETGDFLKSSLPGFDGSGIWEKGVDWGNDEFTCTQACYKVLNEQARNPNDRGDVPHRNSDDQPVKRFDNDVILYLDENNTYSAPGTALGKPVTSKSMCEQSAEFPQTGTQDALGGGDKIPMWRGGVFSINCGSGEPTTGQCTPTDEQSDGNEFEGNSKGPYADKCVWRNFRDINGGFCRDKANMKPALGGVGSHKNVPAEDGMTWKDRESCTKVTVRKKGVKVPVLRSTVPGAGDKFEWVRKDWVRAERVPHNTPEAVGAVGDVHNPMPGYHNAIISLEGDCSVEPKKWTTRHDCIANGGSWDDEPDGKGKGLPKRPRTATIPIWLGDVSYEKYDAGPVSPNMDNSENYYFATVTELRHAAVGQDNYFNYLREFQPFLPCWYHGRQGGKWGNYCPAQQRVFISPASPTEADGASNLSQMGNNGTADGFSQQTMQESGNSAKPGIGISAQGIPCGRPTNPELVDYDKSLISMSDVFKKVQEVATNFYGRKYLMPLPFNPPTVVGCSNPHLQTRTECEEVSAECEGHNINTAGPDGIPGTADDVAAPSNESECTTAQGTWVERGGFDWGAHGIVSHWFRKMGVGRCSDNISPDKSTCEQINAAGQMNGFWMPAMKIEQKWDITGSGWPGGAIDYTFDDTKNTTFPQNMNFWSGDGNLQSFAVYPRNEYRRLKGDIVPLNWGDVDAESMHTSPHNIGLKSYETEKTFVKTDVDPKTYWLKTRPFYEIAQALSYDPRDPNHRDPKLPPEWIPEEGFVEPRPILTRDDEGKYIGSRTPVPGKEKIVEYAFYKPYALITIPNPPRYGDVDYAPSFFDPKENLCVPLIHHKNSNCLQAAWPRAVSQNRMAAQNLSHMANNQQAYPSIVPDGSRSQLVDAAFKPFGAAIPQQSTRYTWGPWAIGRGFGKVEYKQDTSLHPAAFGSEEGMDKFVLNQNVMALQQSETTLETGSVNLAGLPAYHVGTQIVVTLDKGAGLQAYPGPYVTDVSVSIGTGGISTNYNLTTARKFGDLSQQNEEKLRSMQSDLLESKKGMEDLIQRVRRDMLSEGGKGGS